MTDPHVDPGGGEKETSSTLLARVRKKDEEAWRRFDQLYRPLVYTWCRRYGLADSAAADVTQDVFLDVHRTIATFHHDQKGDSLRGWLHTLTRWRVLDFLRRRRENVDGGGGTEARVLLEGLPDPSTLPETVEAVEDPLLLMRRVAEQVLQKYDPDTREVFIRYVIEKQKAEHVAADMNKTRNAVFLIKARVLRWLREEYKGIIDLPPD